MNKNKAENEEKKRMGMGGVIGILTMFLFACVIIFYVVLKFFPTWEGYRTFVIERTLERCTATSSPFTDGIDDTAYVHCKAERNDNVTLFAEVPRSCDGDITEGTKLEIIKKRFNANDTEVLDAKSREQRDAYGKVVCAKLSSSLEY